MGWDRIRNEPTLIEGHMYSSVEWEMGKNEGERIFVKMPSFALLERDNYFYIKGGKQNK